jgi:hypothetical protein
VADQRRAERLGGAADLRDRHVDEPLRRAQPAPFVAVTRADLPIGSPVVAAAAAEEVRLLGLQQLLDHQPRHRLHQRRDDVRLTISTAGEQPGQLLTSDHRQGTLRVGL